MEVSILLNVIKITVEMLEYSIDILSYICLLDCRFVVHYCKHFACILKRINNFISHFNTKNV